MGILSSTVSLTRYRVKNKYDESPIEKIRSGLKKFRIQNIDKEPADIAVGWTSFEKPYQPEFEDSSFIIGNFFVFSLRIDKKSIPAKILKQFCVVEEARRLAETEREFLSKNEKSQLKEDVKNMLLLRIPPTPNVFDIVWDYDESVLWFYSTSNSSNEELESLFLKSFNLSLIRLFPYTITEYQLDLNDTDKDKINNLKPVNFME